MRIVVIGAVRFTEVCLRALAGRGSDVVGLVTLEPELAHVHGDYVDLGPVAADLGVAVHRVRSTRDDDAIELVRSLSPDVILVLGWSQLVPAAMLEIAPAIGSHPALLPRNRGRHPITWALVDGETIGGLTFLWLDEGADTGDILWQRAFRIGPDEDAADVYATIETLATDAIAEFMPQLEAGTAPRFRQDESRATVRRRRTDDDRRIDWSRSSVEIHNLVRGLARPYVGAVSPLEGKTVIVWRTRRPERELTDGELAASPGDVLRAGRDGIVVRTGDGHLTVVEHEVIG